MKTAIYPGSFDPCTNGHLDVITRSAKVFDRLLVGVLTNSAKQPAFSVEERIHMLERVTGHLSNVEIVAFTGLLADFVRSRGVDVIVKGLRAVSDFEYEFQMALTNRKLSPGAETLFMTTSTENMYLSSSVVKEISRYGGEITGMVPEAIRLEIQEKLGGRA